MPAYKLRMRVFGGLDGLMRVVNILRRGKVSYRRLNAVFGNGDVTIEVEVEGDSFEVWWVAAKIERLPETLCIRVMPGGDGSGEKLGEYVAATARA